MSEYNEVELTPDQERKWNDTSSMMIWKAPGFTHLWYKLLNERNKKGGCSHVGVFTKGTPNAATDGKNILFNPDWYFGDGMGIAQRVFVAAHEVVHNVYGDVEFLNHCNREGFVPMHDGTKLPFDEITMQKSMDYRINALLISSKIGAPPKEGNYDKDTKPTDSLLDVYKKHYKKKKEPEEGEQPNDQPGDQPGDQQGPGKGGFDQLLPPGKSAGQNPDQAAKSRDNEQWKVEVAAAQMLENIRAQGKMSADLARMFKDILEPEINWVDHLQTLLNVMTGTGGEDWTQPDNRFLDNDFFLPSDSGYGAGWVAMWGDTSGSISKTEQSAYLGECRGMLEDCRPKRMTMLWCDAKIKQVDEITDLGTLDQIRHRGAPGGGGTNCKPVFDWIAKQDTTPDVLICFTDGYVTFPKSPPPYPVIWCSVSDKSYPWGSVVRILQRAK
jgi:predicted metal-dependent peptidase